MIRKLAIAVIATLGAQVAFAGDFNLDQETLSKKTIVKQANPSGGDSTDKYDFLWKYSPH